VSTFVDAGAAKFLLSHLGDDKPPDSGPIKRHKYHVQIGACCLSIFFILLFSPSSDKSRVLNVEYLIATYLCNMNGRGEGLKDKCID